MKTNVEMLLDKISDYSQEIEHQNTAVAKNENYSKSERELYAEITKRVRNKIKREKYMNKDIGSILEESVMDLLYKLKSSSALLNLTTIEMNRSKSNIIDWFYDFVNNSDEKIENLFTNEVIYDRMWDSLKKAPLDKIEKINSMDKEYVMGKIDFFDLWAFDDLEENFDLPIGTEKFGYTKKIDFVDCILMEE